ncbi:MAG TPA: carboxypeptidase regulatory-like domain-containing protein [Acidobacteriota bacterium]
MKLLRIVSLLCVFCFAFVALFPQSQATTGQVTGQVRDSSGAVLPGVSVKISSADTGYAREVVTNDEGIYTIPLIPPGKYQLAAELSGFQKALVNDIVVTVGSSRTIAVTLQVAGATESVIVSAEAIVETTAPNASATINNTAIDNLPINGRRFQDFITLTPTAQVDTQRGQISMSGQRGINSNINVDGADYNQPFFGGIRGGERSNTAYTIPQESIKEFQVVAAGYSAEFGRSTGGVVNAVTKSGTNNLHGSAFYLLRPKKWAKKNAFDQVAAPTQHQFGGSFGGPIVKDKAFFFAAYEQQRVRNPRAVLFDNLTNFVPTANSKEAFDFYKSLETPFTQTNDAKAVTGRFDYQFNEEHRFNVRYGWSVNNALNANATGNQLFPTTVSALSNNGTERDGTNTVVGQLTSIFSSQVINEARGQYSREKRPRLANALQPNVTDNIGRFGTVNFLPTTELDWRAQGANNTSVIAGNHSVKIGAEINHTFANQFFAFNQFGVFSISGTNTETILDTLGVGGSIPNRFDSTTVSYLHAIGNGQLDLRLTDAAIFVQDAWRIRPNLTLNYGLRWEGEFNPNPVTNNASLLARVQNVRFPSGHTVDPSFIPDNRNQWAPRIGFAWDPRNDAKTVIRAFAGVYYARSPMLLFAGPLNNFRLPPGDLSVQLPFTVPASNPNNTLYKQLKLIGIDLNQFSLGNLPNITPEQIQSIAQALGLTSFDPFTGAQPITWANDYRNPESFQWGGGFEHQLTRDLTVGAEYNQINTDYLQRNRELNLPVPRIRADDPARRPFYGLRSGTARPVPSLGSVQVRESTARSRYQAFTVRTNFHRSWGQFNAFYTLSKSLSDDDNERDAGGVSYEDNYNLRPEYNYARLDRRHQFLANPVIFLPWGFDVASTLRLRSGIPVDAGFGADANEDRGGPDRPYTAPGKPFKRNGFRNLATKEIDLRVQKRFTFAEEHKLIFSLEFFNLFNYDNIVLSGASQVTNFCASPVPRDCGFGSPSNVNFLQIIDHDPSSPRFNQFLLVNNPGAPFQAQIGLRYQF